MQAPQKQFDKFKISWVSIFSFIHMCLLEYRWHSNRVIFSLISNLQRIRMRKALSAFRISARTCFCRNCFMDYTFTVIRIKHRSRFWIENTNSLATVNEQWFCKRFFHFCDVFFIIRRTDGNSGQKLCISTSPEKVVSLPNWRQSCQSWFHRTDSRRQNWKVKFE